MVRSKLRRLFLLPTAAAPALVLAVALAAASCEFFTANIMPAYLSRAEGVADLAELLSDAGVGKDYRIETMRFLKAGKREFIALHLSAPASPSSLVLLDGRDLSFIRSYDNPQVGTVVIVDMDGFVASGRGNGSWMYRISPSDPKSSHVLEAGNPSFGFDAEGFTLGGSTYLLWSSSENSLSYGRYESGWSEMGFLSLPIDGSGTYPGLGFRELLYEDGKVRVLLSSYRDSSGLVLTFPSLLDFENLFFSPGYVLDYPDLSRASVPSGDDESGWLVPGAAIVLSHDNETRLTRYDADSGKKLDSYILRDSEDTRISFSQDGKKWLLFDGRSDRLHLLRTWW